MHVCNHANEGVRTTRGLSLFKMKLWKMEKMGILNL